MERLTISLDAQLSKQFDELMNSRGYTNRSEAMRDLIREKLESERLKEWNQGHCVATLNYIYNHHENDLANRIAAVQHDHHDLILSSMHVHMDHNDCLEVAILRGSVQRVKNFADLVMSARGVRHGKLHMVPVEIKQVRHSPTAAEHIHSNPLT